MRVAVVAEFYPSQRDPVLGVWAHRQALAAREAGAEIQVYVLHRLVPSAASVRSGGAAAQLWALARQPRCATLDGLPVRYLPFVSPPRGRSYARWGSWAAPGLRRALRADGPFDLIHAHNAIPAGDAAVKAAATTPLVISVHGGDVLWTSSQVPAGRATVERTLGAARLVVANSAGIERLTHEHGANRTCVVHLGAEAPTAPAQRSPRPLLVTVGHLVARKRHADVIRALAELPGVNYLVIGDGPERGRLAALAQQLGVAERVELAGALPPAEALRRIGEAWLYVMPSTAEAFGVAYIEAMAQGVPAIGATGEPGPAEIAAAGGGIELVPPDAVPALAAAIDALLSDPARLKSSSQAARATATEHFSWRGCGEQTLAAYREALTP